MLDDFLATTRALVDRELDALLPPVEGPAARVAEAMRYAVLGGGKRLRPALAIAACRACGGRDDDVLAPAAAVELIHTYSLIHDDLPAMDDDDLRRGRPTAHRAFGEAEAILAGDALHTLAFEVLAGRPAGSPADRRIAAVALLARAAGTGGMVGGQMADLEAERRPTDAGRLEWIHRHKTGALIAASTELGAVHAGADDDLRAALSRYGLALGLAFQVADDVLDCTADADALGKTPGKDARAGKATFPALYGLEEARRRAAGLADEAVAELRTAAVDDGVLVALARYAVERGA